MKKAMVKTQSLGKHGINEANYCKIEFPIGEKVKVNFPLYNYLYNYFIRWFGLMFIAKLYYCSHAINLQSQGESLIRSQDICHWLRIKW